MTERTRQKQGSRKERERDRRTSRRQTRPLR